eukprot:scaffold86130_cov52-Phaeocystis_antarctica.AAC.4
MEGWVEMASEPAGPWRQRFLVLHAESSELRAHPHAYLLSSSPPVPSERIALTEQTRVAAGTAATASHALEAGRCDAPPKRQHREFTFVVHDHGGADHRFACASATARDSWLGLISKAVLTLTRSRAQHAEGSSLGSAAGEAQAPVEYLALVAGGLASLAADDIATRLGLPRDEVKPVPEPPAAIAMVRAVPEPPAAEQWAPSAVQRGQYSVLPGAA